MSHPNEQPILSSLHLADGTAAELSELEYGLIVAVNAFNRWIVKCMNAAGFEDLNALDILVLHNINHRNRPKRLSDVAFTLNIEDSHTVGYAIRKLQKLGLLQSEKRGKEMFYSTSEAGEKLCQRYGEIRKQCLSPGFADQDEIRGQLHEAASLLRFLSGQYDQASRAASSL